MDPARPVRLPERASAGLRVGPVRRRWSQLRAVDEAAQRAGPHMSTAKHAGDAVHRALAQALPADRHLVWRHGRRARAHPGRGPTGLPGRRGPARRAKPARRARRRRSLGSARCSGRCQAGLRTIHSHHASRWLRPQRSGHRARGLVLLAVHPARNVRVHSARTDAPNPAAGTLKARRFVGGSTTSTRPSDRLCSRAHNRPFLVSTDGTRIFTPYDDLTRVEAWGYPGGCGGGGSQLEPTVTGRALRRLYGPLVWESRTTARQRYTSPSAERAAPYETAKVPLGATRIGGGSLRAASRARP